MLILYLAFLCTALYLVARILSPEMKRPAPVVPVPRSNVPVSSAPEETDSRIEKLETLLAEKCQDIKHLQRELQIFNIQTREFDKVKVLLDEEILRLRQQNRMFRSELGLPTVVLKENSLT